MGNKRGHYNQLPQLTATLILLENSGSEYASPLPTNQVRELGSLHTNTSQTWVQGSSMALIPWAQPTTRTGRTVSAVRESPEQGHAGTS